MNENNILEVDDNNPMSVARNVHKWFDQFHALCGTDMQVHKGEYACL